MFVNFFFESLGFEFLHFFISCLPIQWIIPFGKSMGKLYCFFQPLRKKIAIENLRNAFPEKEFSEIEFIANQVFENVGITFIEFLWSNNFSREQIMKFVQLENVPALQKIISENNGAVFVSGHFGNWELMALAIGIFIDKQLSIVVKKQRNEFVDKKISLQRSMFGNKLIPMENAIKESLTELNKGNIVALLSDQSAPKESVYVNFFGKNVATFQGPAAFALKTKKPLILFYCIRTCEGNYDLRWEPIDKSDLQNYNEENIYELTQRHTKKLEEMIRKYPEQWLWTHRRWKNVQ